MFVDQLFGFNQFGRWTVNGGAAGVLEVMSVGGPTANRFDVPRSGAGTTATYLKQLGNLALDFSTDELAFYAQDTWRLSSAFTFNYGLRWEGAWNPTPEANNDFMLNALNGFQFPTGHGRSDADPGSAQSVGSTRRLCMGRDWRRKTVVRGYSGLYYARTPAIIWAAPMNNFRVPPGDLSVQLPFTVPAGNPNNTLYRQLLLIGINLNNTPLDQLPTLTTDQITQIGAALGLTVNPFLRAQPILVDEDYKNPRATQVGFGVEREFLPAQLLVQSSPT